ncbi:MAG: prevent-host-death protein [Halieaceae bacterium]|nr:prevent-host-death protein [Halieaceae bacterium]
MKQVSLAIMKDQFSKYLRMTFETEGDWLDYRLENDPRFLQRIAAARQSLLTGSGVSIEELPVEE